MKNLTIPAILSLLAANLAFASNPCGEPAGRSIDVDSGGLVSRTIYRYKNANTFVYSYELDLAGFTPSSEKPTDGLAYSLEVTLDGKSATTEGALGCTTASIKPIVDGRCFDPQDPEDSGLGTTSASFFTYAANGDHLNVWEGDVTVIDPKTSRPDAAAGYHFPEKKFSDMSFQ